jgi:hypothetical protein
MTGQCTSATVRLAKTASRPVGGKGKGVSPCFLLRRANGRVDGHAHGNGHQDMGNQVSLTLGVGE